MTWDEFKRAVDDALAKAGKDGSIIDLIRVDSGRAWEDRDRHTIWFANGHQLDCVRVLTIPPTPEHIGS